MSDLQELRNKIDQIDEEILELLEKRASVALDVGEAKKKKASEDGESLSFYDPEREKKILDRLVAKGKGNFPKEAIKSVYREIISACRSVQSTMQISYLGPVGTYTHVAASKLFGLAVQYNECTTVDAIFDSVQNGESEYGVVPIENSTEGGVASTLDRLVSSDLKICREIVVPIEHCLLSRAEQLSDIQKVISHSQALAQCRSWLETNLPNAQLVEMSSTAMAAKAATADPVSASIGSDVAGEIYGLNVLRKSIQDTTQNATRFVVLRKQDSPKAEFNKTSIVFASNDGPGSLWSVLEIFKDNEINLTRIESRASRQKMWEYLFFVDLEGHRSESKIAKCLEELKRSSKMVRVLGSYPTEGIN